ncbi:DUF402 domain-containing protein [Allokutzneria oryzae]|uniref:DUF402 domain-containing protein n=1 Tax=Allokutzneria oryzae TaxID=1378989 RepID=A0ABV6A6B5_9PSEU
MTLSAAHQGPDHIHPPKVEVFDVDAGTNTDPKGFVRQVDEYRTEPFGLYMARPTPGHPRLAYFRSWLLPDLGLRVGRWSWHPGCEESFDYYLDVVNISRVGNVWRTKDLYLDLLVTTGSAIEVLDIDELLTALGSGLIAAEEAERALAVTHSTVDGVSRNGYDLEKWLTERGIALSWKP